MQQDFNYQLLIFFLFNQVILRVGFFFLLNSLEIPFSIMQLIFNCCFYFPLTRSTIGKIFLNLALFVAKSYYDHQQMSLLSISQRDGVWKTILSLIYPWQA